MIRFTKALIIFITTFSVINGFSQSDKYRKSVHFEWEEIKEATGYEIEFSAKNNSKIAKKLFKTKVSIWDGRLEPGIYSIKLRSLDHRSVPGEWSDSQELVVGLDNVNLTLPKEEEIHTHQLNTAKVSFEWENVLGVVGYEYIVTSSDGVLYEAKIKDNKISLDFPVGKTIDFQVRGFSDKSQSELWTKKSIKIFGKLDAKPEIFKPESEFVRNIEWKYENKDVSYVYSLDHLENNKWLSLEKNQAVNGKQIAFSSKYPGGKYRFKVKAVKDLFDASLEDKIEFEVFEGDRSATSEYVHELRKSIDQLNGWSVKSSYMITMIDYQSVFIDNNYRSSNSLNPIGGTLRGGASYVAAKKNLGYDFYIDASGFLIEGVSYSYFAVEGNRTWSSHLNDVTDMLMQFGGMIKEVPQVLRFSNQSQTVEKVMAFSPHVGAEFWRAISPKYGLQVNVHSYLNLVKINSKYGGNMVPTLTNQLGIMGSYLYRKNVKFFLGYTYRAEEVELKSNVDEPYKINSTGHYISTGMNWML